MTSFHLKFEVKSSWYRAPKRERRKDINTIAPKYYQMAENQSAEMTIAPKNATPIPLQRTVY